jgi:hypothetical protein
MTEGQFSLVPMEVIQDKRLTLEQTRVLIALFSFRSRTTDTVWPSRAAIAERTGMHPSNISAATTALVTLGWLLKVGSGGHSKASRYTLCNPGITVTTVAQSATVAPATTVAQSATVVGPTTVAEQTTVADAATVAEQARGAVAEQATPPVADSARGKEQTIEQTTEQTISRPAAPTAVKVKAELVDDAETALQAACRSTWAAYSAAYEVRYGAKPVRNQSVNAKVKQFVQRIGHDESPAVAEFYVARVNDAFVVRKVHDVGLLLSGAEGYRTQWAAGSAMTGTRAKQIDQTQSNADVATEAMAILRQRRQGAPA